MAVSSGETVAHHQLQRAALRWAQERDFTVATWEVRVPHSPYRADVAACRPVRSQGVPGETALFECKQSRADFLRDHHDLEANLERLAELRERRARLEHRLGIHFPSLRRGDSLFPDYESVDLSGHRHAGYRSVCREVQRVERRIYGKTKFHRMVRWTCADALYLVVPEGLAAAEELPEAWGVLVAPSGGNLTDPHGPCPELELRRRPRWLEASPGCRLELLQRIAVRATSLTNSAADLSRDEIREHRDGALSTL